MSFAKAVSVFLPAGKNTQQYRLTRNNADGSKDEGVAYVHLGPHNLSQFRSFTRTLPNGSTSRVEDVIYITSHENDVCHWVWFNNKDEAWVGEQEMFENGIRVRGFGLIGRNRQQFTYENVQFDAYREGDKVYGRTSEPISGKLVSEAMYEPQALDGHIASRIAEHFGFPTESSEMTMAPKSKSSALTTRHPTAMLQMVVGMLLIVFALTTKDHRMFMLGLAFYLLLCAINCTIHKNWYSVVLCLGLSACCAMFSQEKHFRF
jgi:hypothetical protein